MEEGNEGRRLVLDHSEEGVGGGGGEECTIYFIEMTSQGVYSTGRVRRVWVIDSVSTS